MYDPTNLEVVHNQTHRRQLQRPITGLTYAGDRRIVVYKTGNELGDLFLETMWVPNEVCPFVL